MVGTLTKYVIGLYRSFTVFFNGGQAAYVKGDEP
jgi:hypothetical protein